METYYWCRYCDEGHVYHECDGLYSCNNCGEVYSQEEVDEGFLGKEILGSII